MKNIKLKENILATFVMPHVNSDISESIRIALKNKYPRSSFRIEYDGDAKKMSVFFTEGINILSDESSLAEINKVLENVRLYNESSLY